MANEFTVDQVGRLREIERARIRRGGGGLRDELQALINRLSKKKPSRFDLQLEMFRKKQARILWDHGWDRDTYPVFEDYLATIPSIPPELVPLTTHFPYLVLVDGRTSIARAAHYLHVDLHGGGDRFVDIGPKELRPETMYWFKCTDHQRAFGKSVCECRETMKSDETGLTLFEALSWFAQNHQGGTYIAAMDTSYSYSDGTHDKSGVAHLRCYERKGEVYRLDITTKEALSIHCLTRFMKPAA